MDFSLTLIKSIDLYGYKPTLYINNTSKLSSLIGGVFSILLIILTIIGTILFGQEIWLKQKPTTNTSTSFNSNPRSINYLNESQFFIALRDQNKGGALYINEKIYKPEAFLLTFNTTLGANVYVPVNIEQCTKDSFTPENLEIFKNLEFINAYCLSQNQAIELKLRNLFSTVNSTFIFFRFRQCMNNTDNNSCSPQSTIDSYLSSTNLAIYAIDNYIQTKDYLNPLKKGFQNYFFRVSLQTLNGIQLYLRDVAFVSDIGLIAEELSYSYGFRHEYTFYNPGGPQGKYFAQFGMQYSPTLEMNYRVYMKLQDIAAQIGGLLNLLMLIGRILLELYYTNTYKLYLYNNLFYGVDSDSTKQMIPMHNRQSQQAIIKDSVYVYKNNLSNFNDDIPQSTFIKKKLKLNFFEKFLCANLYIKRNIKLLNFEAGSKFIKGRLDTAYLLKAYFDLDKIKYFLLNNDQLSRFDNLSFPRVENLNNNGARNYPKYILSNDKKRLRLEVSTTLDNKFNEMNES
jgi:hypothetical protein